MKNKVMFPEKSIYCRHKNSEKNTWRQLSFDCSYCRSANRNL